MSFSGRTHKRRIKTAWDAVLALYQLIDDVLPRQFDLGQIFQAAATHLAESKSAATTFRSETLTTAEEAEQQLLLLYNTLLDILFQRPPLADTTPNRRYAMATLTQTRAAILDALPDQTSDTIDPFLQTFIEQPQHVTTQWEQKQLTPVEMQITRHFIDHLRQAQTPIEQLNRLIAALIDPERAPLTDTATNADYATTVLDTVRETTRLELASQDIEANALETFLAATFAAQETASLPHAKTIHTIVKTTLEPSLHTSLTLFNILQWHFNYPALPDTVENDERAKKALRQILQALSAVEEIGQEAATTALEKIVTSPEQDIPQTTDTDKAIVAIINEQLLMTLYPNFRAAERPELYPRIMADLALQDKHVMLAEKISVLTQLGAILADRPQYTVTERTNDPLMHALENMGNDAETLAIHLIKALYAMRFGDEEPEPTIAAQPLTTTPDVEETTTPPSPKIVVPLHPDSDEETIEQELKRAFVPSAPRHQSTPPARTKTLFDDSEDTDVQRAPSPIKPRAKGERIHLPPDPGAEKQRQDERLTRELATQAEREREKQQQAEEWQRLQQSAPSHEQNLIDALRDPHNDRYIDLFKPRKIDSDLTDLTDVDEKKPLAINSRQALHDYLFTYTAAQIAPDNLRKQRIQQLVKTHGKPYQTLIQQLLQLIQETTSASKTTQFAAESAALATAYAELNEVDDLHAFSQTEIIRAAILHAFEIDKALPRTNAILTQLAKLNGSTISQPLMTDIISLVGTLQHSPDKSEREAADDIQEAIQAHAMSRALLLTAKLSQLVNPPGERAAKNFLQQLAKLNAKPATTEETLLNAFKVFLHQIRSPAINTLISTATQKIQSPRLQQMKHIAMLFLENLEVLYRAAEDKSSPHLSAFADCRKSVWELSTHIEGADAREMELLQLLNGLLQNLHREMTLHVDAHGILRETRTDAEDERLRLLSPLADYSEMLASLKKILRPNLNQELTPIRDAVRTFMQAILTVKPQDLAALRTDIANAAVGYEQSLARILHANKQPAPTARQPSTLQITRSLGQLNLLAETRNKEQALKSRQQALAAIFKPNTLNKK